MSQASLRNIRGFFVLFLGLFLVPAASAEDSLRATLLDAQALIRGSTRQIIEEEMTLDDSQRDKFWAVYNDYAAEQMAFEEKYINVVSEFIDQSRAGTLDNRQAQRLLDASLKSRVDALKARQRQVRKFRKVLSGIQVLRLYQIEGQIHAEVNAALARAIPLVEMEAAQ